LKNRAKSGDMAVLQLTFRNMSLGKCPKIDPATGVTRWILREENLSPNLQTRFCKLYLADLSVAIV